MHIHVLLLTVIAFCLVPSAVAQKTGPGGPGAPGPAELLPAPDVADRLAPAYEEDPAAALTAAYAAACGWPTHPRDCGACSLRDRCPATLREPWRGR